MQAASTLWWYYLHGSAVHARLLTCLQPDGECCNNKECERFKRNSKDKTLTMVCSRGECLERHSQPETQVGFGPQALCGRVDPAGCANFGAGTSLG